MALKKITNIATSVVADIRGYKLAKLERGATALRK